MPNIPSARAALRRFRDEHPMAALLVIAGAVRLVAALVARGFMANDDYFVYVHVPWLWAHGVPRWFDMDHPSGFSLVYPGINYLLFRGLAAIGVVHPDTVMTINRLAHAAWSLGAVAGGYALAREATGDRTAAFRAGLLLALFSFLPYGSVRNLPEVVCLPLLMASLVFGERAARSGDRRSAMIAGIAAGAAFVLRYQTFLFFAGPFVLFPARKQWKLLGAYALGLAAPLVVQGIIDQIAYGKFFGAPIQYFDIKSFLEGSSGYPSGPWYRYLLLLFGLFIPPYSLFLFAGAWKGKRTLPITAIGTLAFIAFHSIIPPKQERFIIPAIPPLLVLGVVGLYNWKSSGMHERIAAILRGSARWFWIANTILLVLFVSHYGKRGQIEALLYIYDRGDARRVMVDRTENDCWLPLMYGNLQEDKVDWIDDKRDYATLRSRLDSGAGFPNYAIVLDPKNIQETCDLLARQGLRLRPVESFGPGALEWLLWRLNPRFNKKNAAWVCTVERIE